MATSTAWHDVGHGGGAAHLGSEADRATFRALHQASLASPALREGLTADSAERAIRHLRTLLGTPALALTDTRDGAGLGRIGGHHETRPAHWPRCCSRRPATSRPRLDPDRRPRQLACTTPAARCAPG